MSPEQWPRDVPSIAAAAVAAALVALSSAAFGFANRRLQDGRLTGVWVGLPLAIVLFSAGFGVELFLQRALSPSESAYGALVYLFIFLAGFFGLVGITLALFVLAKAAKGMVDPVRRVTFDNARLLWHYAVGQTLVGLALVHGFPRLIT